MKLDADDLKADFGAATAVAMLAVPQGIAYAMIAGLPPVVGLYAAIVPTILASLLRSSIHVVSGPTNAISLLVGGALAMGTIPGEPVMVAVQIAFLAGAAQLLAGVLRLGVVVNYISRAVVLGYITGAAALIGLGQLGNLTGTSMPKGDPVTRLIGWAAGLGGLDYRAVVIGAATVALLVFLRRFAPRVPGAAVVMTLGILVSWLFDFKGLGIRVASDIAPVPLGLPPFDIPWMDLEQAQRLIPVAVAASVLTLLETSSVARSIASETGQRLDMNREFAAQGIANIGAAFTGGYPISGSLSRSALNYASGARTRLSGVLVGVFTLIVLVVAGPMVDLMPIPSLAGLLLILAWDLIDLVAINHLRGALMGDRLAFATTVLGTWTLPLDSAIYLGVGISMALFLWRVRHIRVNDLVVDDARIRETHDHDHAGHCKHVRAIHVEGNLFFGAADELQEALDEAVRDPQVKVLVVRLKRAQGLDYTSAGVLISMRARMVSKGRHLLLAGMTPNTMRLFEDVGLVAAFGRKNLFPTQTEWFLAMNAALERGLTLAGEHDDCPLRAYLDGEQERLDKIQNASPDASQSAAS